MKTIQELCTEYQDIVLDMTDVLEEGGFRGGRGAEAPRIIFPAPAGEKAETPGDGHARPEQALMELSADILRCKLCPLCEKRTRAVPGAGVLNPLVMVIGEGPGAEEDIAGEPFVGRAGAFLDKWLAAVSLSRETNAYIANIVKCRPPENRDPLPEETAACMPYLLRQIEIVRPRTVLAVGRIAAQNLLGTAEGISRLRGKPSVWNGLPFLATYHPSAVLRDESLKRPVWEDMKTLKKMTDNGA